MFVSTSIATPSVAPSSEETREISRRFSSESMQTVTRARLESEAARRILSAVTTWLGISTSSMPPSTMTSASATLAEHTPPIEPPMRICMWATSGLLTFLVCSRSFTSVSRYVSAMRRKLCSRSSRSSSRQGVSSSAMGVPTAGL